jgi:cell division septal protein FtsQ
MRSKNKRYLKNNYSRNNYILKKNKKRLSSKKRKVFFRFFLFLLFIILLIINIHYLLFKSSIFKISSVDIYIESENTDNDYSDIKENIEFFVDSQMILDSSYFKNKKQNILLLFDENYLKEKIENEYKNIIYDIKINKKYPNRLKIELKKRIPSILFVSFDGKYYVDRDGYIVYKIKDSIIPEKNIVENDEESKDKYKDGEEKNENSKILMETSSDLIEKDILDINISDYYNLNDSEILDLDLLSLPTIFIEEELDFYNLQNLDKNYVTFTKIILNRLPKINVGVANIKIPTLNDSKLVVTTDKNYNLYFNLNKDPEKQIRYLNIFLSERKENEIMGINYIDLRFDSRIFYK